MPTRKSPVSTSLRYGLSALGHAIYWFTFLNLAFSIGNVDFGRTEHDGSASMLVAGLWVIAGIVMLSALTLAARRLPGAKG